MEGSITFLSFTIFMGHQEPKCIPVAKALHAIFYGIISIRLVLQYRKHLTETTSPYSLFISNYQRKIRL